MAAAEVNCLDRAIRKTNQEHLRFTPFQVGKGEGHSSPSPLSRWGQFPIFTGEPLSGTGRRHSRCPESGATQRFLRWWCADFAEEEQTLIAQVFQTHTPIVGNAFSFELHTADAHANPAV